MSRQPASGDHGHPVAGEHATSAVLRASADALLDPCVLLDAVRDSSGRIVDFRYLQINQAACEQFGLSRAELVGRGVVEISPEEKVLLPGYIRCLETGEALVVNDFCYEGEIRSAGRRYDLRATRATPTSIVLTWRDVTERFHLAQRLAVSEARYHRTMDNAAIGMCLVAPDGRFVEVNDALCRYFGYDAATLTTKTWQELTGPDYLEADQNKVDDVLEGRLESYRMVKQFIDADGHLIWGDLSVSCVRDEHGLVEYFISQIIDITAQVETEATYRLLAENAGDVVCRTREDDTGGNRIVWISPSVQSVLGHPPEFWLDRPLMELISPEDVQAHLDRWKKVRAGGTASGRVRMPSADGVMHWFHVTVKPFHDAAGHGDGAVITAHMVDDEVAAEQVAEAARRQQAKADERFRRAMDSAAVGICLMDSEGHVEEVNHEMCRFLGYDADTLRSMAWYEVIDPDYREENQTYINAMVQGHTDSHRMINQYVHADGHRMWGDHAVTCIRDDDGRVENFLVQVTDVTPVERELRERLEFEEFLAHAISDGHMLAYAQPIVDARTGQEVEEELLVRIARPDGTVMLPSEFLPQALRFGMMPTIDRFMVARAIELAQTGRRVAVNLSAASINDAATISAILEDLRHAGDAAHRVSFEITEHTALASTDLAKRFSDDMRELGCRLALDDFGTGFGSFTELRGMTLHKLKIDQSFVTHLLHSPQNESVVRAIVGIASEFGLLTTAEGVEDTATRNRLVELGVDQLQGFLITRPTPAMTTTSRVGQ